MTNQRYQPVSGPMQTLKKFALSAFVIGAFAVYVVAERLSRPDASPAASATGPAETTSTGSTGGLVPFSTAPAGASSGGANASVYKSGTYQGQAVDAYYGLVQVQVNIQSGVIKNVDVVQFPNDRRTSRQINSIAIPYLQQEAIQAQSANVNIISGATLTSEGFAMSLQTALQAAQH